MNIRILLLATAMLLGTIGTFAQAPANDDPCAAIPLPVSATCTYATYTNANATATAGVPAPGCASYSGGDVWFTFTVPASGAVTIDAIQGVITDGGMAVYSATACNGTFSLISCNDDNSPNGLMPLINIAGQTPGATLYIRFWEYGNNGNGTFGICLTAFTPPTPPANDNPCAAIPVTVTNSCAYTQYTNANATATAGVPAPGCASYSGGDVWFSFVVPASGNVTLDGNTGVITDGGMAVYSATACNGTFTLIQCDDDNSANGLMPSLNLTGLAPGATMYVRFWEYGNDNNGTFSLCIFDSSLPPPPPNNACLSPIPDICFAACNLGALPTPAPCTAGATISTGALTSFGMSNVGAIAENPYNAVVGCAIPATDVWYRFQATGTQLAMSITSLANALNNPNISLYNGNNCNALLPLGCFTGAGGSLAATFSPTTPGDFYYLQISGGNAADVGDFILNIRNNLDCATCLLAQDLQVTPPPVNGTYAAGQTVNFCFTVSNYNQTSVNWLHGIDLNFGAGWNVATLAPTSIPAACATTPPGGFWGFYNSVTSSHTPFGTYGPGFFFETSSGNPSVPAVIDGNPGNNFGDQGVGLTCPRTFCWQITTQPPGACTPGASLQVGINTLGDSESGIWSSNGCGTDPVVNFLAALACCAQPIITTTNASCGLNDGEIAATGQGSAPWDYVWANSVGTVIATHNNVNGTDSIGSLAAGNYSLTVTDNLGCSVAVSITVNGVATATAVAANSGPFCAGQTIALTSSNGGTGYSWNGPGGYTSTAQNPTLAGATGVMAGNYSVTVTYGPGCTATDVTNVVVNAVPVPAIAPVTVSICNGASATLTASGGNTYAWSNLANTAAVTVSPVLTTSYSVTVTDANFCTASMSRTVTVNSLPTAIINPAVVAICNGASATLTASGGTSYLWSNAGNTAAISVSPIITTSYTVTVTDANTCTATATRTVTVNPLPIPVINPAVVAICNGASATLTASGGTSYLWSNAGNTAAITVSPAITTSYTVTVTDVNTCTATATRTVTVNTLPTAIINPAVVAICNGASTTLTASGGTSYLWSNAANTAAITVSPIITTTYDVTVTDANACTGNTSRTVTVNTLPTAIINPAVVAICNGASATLTASGGTSYLWSNAANTAAISVSPVTTSSYTVTVTDANTCTATATRTVTVNSLPTAIINPAVVAICNGASATLTASGGTNYLWSNAGNTAAITVSPAITTSYTVTVTDVNTCTATATRTVTVNTLPTAIINPAVVAICNGASTTLTASGGTSYLWSNAANTAAITVSPIITTTYDVTVTDANACTGNTSRTVTVNTLPTAIINPAVVAICNGASATLTASGGTSYLWSNAANTAAISVSPVTTSSYTVTVTDANTCTATATRTVTVNSLPTAIINPAVVAICNGASATLTASGGTNYLWSNAGNTAAITVSPVITTSYTVTVTDANTCTATAIRTVTVNTLPTAVINPAVVAICNGASTTLTASGGTSYLWSDASITATITVSPIATTTYDVTVTDANACIGTTSRTVTVNPLPIPIINPAAIAICNGASVTITAGGGTNYLWSNAAITAAISVSPITTTTYDVTVTDANLCTATTSSTVTVNQLPTAIINPSTSTICNGTSATLTASGGTTYLWSDASLTAAITVSPIGTFSYSVTVTDVNNCTATASRTVTVIPTMILVTAVTDVACNGGNTGAIDLTANSGQSPYTFLWNDAVLTEDRNNIPAANYLVTVTDNAGCTATTAAIISEPTVLIFTETHTNVLCNGGSSGSIDVTANGGTSPYTYLWSDAVVSEDRNNIPTGNYSVTISDNQLCTAAIAVNISEPTALAISETHVDVPCGLVNAGSIDITVSGATLPYTYLWNDGVITQDRTNIPVGNYSITATDNNACSISLSATVSSLAGLVISETHADATCNAGNSGTIDVTLVGNAPPFTYLWNDGIATQDRTNLLAGVYSVTATDVNTCIITLSVTINQPSALVVTETHTNALCNGGSSGTIDVTATAATPPYTYLWNDGITTEDRNNIAAGNYSVTVRDLNLCSASITLNISEPTALVVTETHLAALCFGAASGSIDITASAATPPYTYLWNDAAVTEDRNNIAAGNYSVVVNDLNSCTASISIFVSQPTLVTVNETHTNALCNGASDGSINITSNGGTPGYFYLWNDAITTEDRTNIAAGNYSVVVNDLNSCTATLSVVISEPAVLTAVEMHSNASCLGYTDGVILITVTGGTSPYSYLWDDGNANLNRNNLGAGAYSITVTDNNSCTVSTVALVTEPAGMALSSSFSNPTCETNNFDGNILLNVTGGSLPYHFDWSNGSVQSNLLNVAPGNYSVTVSDANNCTVGSTFSLAYLYDFSVQATPMTTINIGESTTLGFTLTGNAGNYTSIWSPASTLSCIDCVYPVSAPNVTTLYQIEIRNDVGCIAIDTVTVLVIPDYSIFVPNAFTPNNDGNNDVFRLFGNIKTIAYLDIQIFNRIGEKVFESQDHNFGWDGTYKGVLQNPSVFIWQMKLTFLDGHREELRKGSVTLMR